MHPDFVDLLTSVPHVDGLSQYAGMDNFTGGIVEGYKSSKIPGTLALSHALQKASLLAREKGLRLFLFDAYRPCRAVEYFLKWSLSPEDGKTKEKFYPAFDKTQLFSLGYIATRSGHSRGSTVDLTLIDAATGLPLDMGGHFDLMDPISHHNAPQISPLARFNRQLLLRIMTDCGFRSYENEWWHYTLENEPYPDTYFDFPI